MEKKKTSRKISDDRKNRIIAALKERELSPEEVAKKARLPFETVVNIVKDLSFGEYQGRPEERKECG